MLTLAWTYLRIGMIFFGGGYVLIPLLQHLLVDQYKWLTLREFLDGVAISQLTPGPLAMLATFTGVRVGGFTGGLIATLCIFAPCIVLMLVVGRYYARLKEIDLIRSTLDGVLPAVVGLVASAAWSLGATLGSLREWVILVVAFCIFRWTKINPMVMILGAGLSGMLL
jgi:chromate transporter